MNPNHLDADAVKEVGKHIRHAKVAMFTTRSNGDRLISRPLHTRDTEFDGNLWFFTGLDTTKVSEIQTNPRVNLAYVDAGDGAFLSVEGRAEIVRDQHKVDELWSDAVDSIFFKGGKTDPNLALIKVTCESAELWTSSSTAIGRVYSFIKAKITGDEKDLGAHKHVELKH